MIYYGLDPIYLDLEGFYSINKIRRKRDEDTNQERYIGKFCIIRGGKFEFGQQNVYQL